MSVRLLSFTTTTTQLRQQTVYTRARLDADPRGAAFRDLFKQLHADWRVLATKEFDLQDALNINSAGVEYADLEADLFVDEVDAATTDNSSLRPLFFGTKTPSVFKRPIAGSQLTAMETWPATLKNAQDPAVKALAEGCVAVLEKANAAVKQRTEAARALREFYATGERRRYTERLNAARVEVFSHFDTLVINDPSLGLTRQYARAFFLQNTYESDPTPEEELLLLQGELETLRQDLIVKEERQKELLALKESREREDVLAQERQSKIEELERELTSLKQASRKRA